MTDEIAKKKRIKKKNESIVLTDDSIFLTKEGLEEIKREYDFLKISRRKEVALRLKEAISYGDLSENSEYEEAKNEQAFVEGRIVELEKMIKNAQIIDEKKAHSAKTVQIGTIVEIRNKDREEDPEIFTIVGSTEADPFQNRISNESPIGSSLLGHKKGDMVQISTPGGKASFEILDLK